MGMAMNWGLIIALIVFIFVALLALGVTAAIIVAIVLIVKKKKKNVQEVSIDDKTPVDEIK